MKIRSCEEFRNPITNLEKTVKKHFVRRQKRLRNIEGLKWPFVKWSLHLADPSLTALQLSKRIKSIDSINLKTLLILASIQSTNWLYFFVF